MLQSYLDATNRLLQNPVPSANALYSNTVLTAFINEGRLQLAADTECIRATATAAINAGTQQYTFAIFGTFVAGGVGLSGISTVQTIKQMAVGTGTTYQMMYSRSWPWFNRFRIAYGAAPSNGTPREWAQQGLGSQGTFAIGPPPTTGLNVQADCVCIPIALTDDSTAEALPWPFTDAIPYYAAYKAYLASQKRDDATTMLGRYKEFAMRAVQMSGADVNAPNYQGTTGSMISGARQPLTKTPAQGGGPQ